MFWSVISYSLQKQWTISWSDFDVWWKVDFIWQPARPAQWLEQKKLQSTFQSQTCTKKSHGQQLFGGLLLSDLLQFYETWWNHFIWEVCSANQWDALKTAMPAAGIGQQNEPNSPWQCPTTHPITNASKVWMNWATKFCLICHIHLTSCQLTTTFSRTLRTFCRESASKTNKKQKMLSKSSLTHEAWIFLNVQNWYQILKKKRLKT